jgi:hypothetical protein
MTKMFFLSLLLIPTAVHCMNKIPCNIARERNRLEVALYNARGWIGLRFEDPLQYLVICRYPKHTYGYVETDNEFYKGALLDHNVETLSKMNMLKNARYKGYSAMGVATLPTDISDQEKNKIIQNLYAAGCRPTEKDIELAPDLGLLVSYENKS